MTEAMRHLHGITVVSLEQYIAAPYCTQVLADAGATVIKIEKPGTGDPRRSYEPLRTVGGQTMSGGFASYNRGKLSVALDLFGEQDRLDIEDLLATADVLVSNLRPGALARSGFDPARLRAEYPRLVICEITGFGTTGGPAENWPAFDSVIQAMSGLSSLIGATADSEPLLAPMGTVDLLSGTWAALGISLALYNREKTGCGAHVDVAMLDVGAALLERPLVLHEFTGDTPTRGRDSFSPVGTFRAADRRWLSIVIPTDAMWKRCCHAIGRPELVDDPQLDSVLKRAAVMQSTIVPVLEEWAMTEKLDADQVAQRLRDHGQPVGVVHSIDQVRVSPQLEHRDFFAPLGVMRDGNVEETDVLLPTMPLLFDGVRARPGVVPSLGEHNRLVDEMRSRSGS